jgi:hypothetical protein
MSELIIIYMSGEFLSAINWGCPLQDTDVGARVQLLKLTKKSERYVHLDLREKSHSVILSFLMVIVNVGVKQKCP